MAKKKDEPTIPTPAVLKWVVSLPYLPELTVEAIDEESAYEAYKTAMGIIKSDHKPKVDPLPEG